MGASGGGDEEATGGFFQGDRDADILRMIYRRCRRGKGKNTRAGEGGKKG